MLDWIIRHVEQVDDEKLLQEAKGKGDLSVLGVLGYASRLRIPHPKFDRIIRSWVRHDNLEPFFHRVARSRLASRLAYENALDVFRKWNYMSSELRYL